MAYLGARQFGSSGDGLTYLFGAGVAMAGKNCITDVPGITVGQHHRLDDGWATGTTVVIATDGAVGAVDQRGGAPGTRETNLLEPENLVHHVNAICLSGGSAYGLAAADGVMRWLGERNHGFPVGSEPHEVVPIVPSAVIFDLPRSSWGNRVDADFGYAACESATDQPVVQGTIGAGSGAVAGSIKGGVGTASEVVDGFTVGALVVVNTAGEVVDLETGRPFCADHEVNGEFNTIWPDSPGVIDKQTSDLNTTIGVVAVDAALGKAECRRLTIAAQDGLARAARPSHTMFDGDTVFALATGARDLPTGSTPYERAIRAVSLDALCSAAARVFSRAIIHGILNATSIPQTPAYHDIWPQTPAK